MTLLLFACLMSLHLSFLWARFAFFRIDGPTHVGVRVIEVAGTASVVAGATLIRTKRQKPFALQARVHGRHPRRGAHPGLVTAQSHQREQ